MNILVTGANGQLGNEMRRVSLDSRNRYLFTDVNELDITDATAVCNMLKKEQIDVIVNCAAYTNVDRAEDDFAMADLLNNKAVENLAVAAAEQVPRLFMYLQTMCSEGIKTFLAVSLGKLIRWVSMEKPNWRANSLW